MSGLPEWFTDVDWHPAVLSGEHAWHLHGLTTIPPSPDHIAMVVAQRHQDTVDTVLNDAWAHLRAGWWHGSENVQRTDLGVEVTDAHGRVVVTVDVLDSSHRLGGPTVAMRPGEPPVPVIGRDTALRQRLAAVRTHPSVDDLVDIARWAKPLDEPNAISRLQVLTELASVQRDPGAMQGLRHALQAARDDLRDHPRLQPSRGVFQRLARTVDAPSRQVRR